MTTPKTYAQKLQLADHLRAPLVRQAIRALELPRGSRGLDAGCGAGSLTLQLAAALGPQGQVTGLDRDHELLAAARSATRDAAQARQLSFQRGDLKALPFGDDRFDWAWSSDCVGYPTGEPAPLRELCRVVKPGGKLALMGWTSQQLLPGYPLLEARLNAASLRHAALLEAADPEAHFACALGRLRAAGVERPTAHTFAGSVQAPLSAEIRDALQLFFEMLWGPRPAGATQEDREHYARLTDPESPDFILDRADYYAFFTCSLFEGALG